MTGNVLKFVRPAVKATGPPGDDMELSAYGALMTISWAWQVGRYDEAKEMLDHLWWYRGEEYIPLTDRLSKLFDEADFYVAAYGPEGYRPIEGGEEDTL